MTYRWPTNPLVYEINTWPWLHDLSQAAGLRLTLADVPQAELERLASYGFDGVWLMGVWQRSVGARQVARTHSGLQREYEAALPGYADDDVVGSPYAIYSYRVDPALGGDNALATLRSRLRALGLGLILDFVPNHLALDHPWVADHPEYLLRGGPDTLAREPGNYFQVTANGQWRVFAHGRDPNFDGWTDTVQIDYRAPAARRAVADTLLSIAERCDGVRCDMAMLVTQDIFQRTWGGRFEPPQVEFWPCAITDLKTREPEFLLLAEVYWGLEWDLQQQGFDYTYDKRLYDRLLEGDALSVRMHLTAGLDYQQHSVRFVENHDERRAAEAFGPERSKAAAMLALTLPGMRLVHEGQIEGRRTKVPVQLGRRLPESDAQSLAQFYKGLLPIVSQPLFRQGAWRLLRPLPEWDGNSSHRQVVAYSWSLGLAQDPAAGGRLAVVVVNLSGQSAQFFLPLEIADLAGRDWLLRDELSGDTYVRSGDEILSRGLYVDLAGYAFHLLDLTPAV